MLAWGSTKSEGLQQQSPGSRSAPGVWWWIVDERRRCSTNGAVVKPFQGLRLLIRANDLWCAARPQAVLLNSFAVGCSRAFELLGQVVVRQGERPRLYAVATSWLAIGGNGISVSPTTPTPHPR